MSSCRYLWLFKAEHIIDVYFEALLTYEITIIFSYEKNLRKRLKSEYEHLSKSLHSFSI